MNTLKPLPPSVQEHFENIYRLIVESFRLQSRQQIPPALLMFKNGKPTALPLRMEDERDKQIASLTMRIASELIEPDFTLFVTEAWMVKCAKNERPLNDDGSMKLPPSRDPRRQDTLTFQAAYPGGHAMAFVELQTLADGSRIIPEDPPQLEPTEAEGRMTVIIPEVK